MVSDSLVSRIMFADVLLGMIVGSDILKLLVPLLVASDSVSFISALRLLRTLCHEKMVTYLAQAGCFTHLLNTFKLSFFRISDITFLRKAIPIAAKAEATLCLCTLLAMGRRHLFSKM